MFQAPTTEQIEALQAEHGDDLRIVDYDDHTFAIALPKEDAKVGALYQRFIDMMDQGKKEAAFASLFPAMAVYPDKDTIKSYVKRRPGAVRVIGAECVELLGIVPANAKKA